MTKGLNTYCVCFWPSGTVHSWGDFEETEKSVCDPPDVSPPLCALMHIGMSLYLFIDFNFLFYFICVKTSFVGTHAYKKQNSF